MAKKLVSILTAILCMVSTGVGYHYFDKNNKDQNENEYITIDENVEEHIITEHEIEENILVENEIKENVLVKEEIEEESEEEELEEESSESEEDEFEWNLVSETVLEDGSTEYVYDDIELSSGVTLSNFTIRVGKMKPYSKYDEVAYNDDGTVTWYKDEELITSSKEFYNEYNYNSEQNEYFE